jgi:hypothetical protein
MTSLLMISEVKLWEEEDDEGAKEIKKLSNELWRGREMQ